MLQHAKLREQQRGITAQLLALHEMHADNECFVGDGCISRTLSYTVAEELKVMGIRQQQIEKLKKIAIVYTPEDEILTLLFIRPGHGRTYCHGTRKRFSKRNNRH